MKKLISTVLVGSLAVTAAGCGGGKNEGEAPGADGKQGPTKFTISLNTSGNAYAESSTNINEDKWVKKLEKLGNVDMDIRFLPLKEFDQKMAVMFAGNDIPDVVQGSSVNSKAMSGSVEAELFMPLDDLLKEYAPNLMKQVPKQAWDEVSYQGKIYAVPAWLSNPSRRALFIRTDLLEKTGLPAPKTVEDMLNVMRAMKKLGVENPYQIREKFKYADTIFGSYDVIGSQFELQDGQVVPKFFDVENMTKALQAYKTMFDEGLIPKDFATVTSTDYGKNIEAGKVGMWSANAEGMANYRTKVKKVVPEAKIDIIPSPKGPEGHGGHLLYGSLSTALYINNNVKKETAIGIVKFLDWMLTDEAEKFFSIGVEGENYTVENGQIKYKFPQTKEEVDEEGFRSNLWWAHDITINKLRASLSQDGKDLAKAFDTVLAKEGLGTIEFTPTLNAFAKYPDLMPTSDTAPKLIIDPMVKMIYGKEPISDWPKVIEEYKAKGGNEVIKEATDRYNKKEGVIVRNNVK
ncbi:extracellular solute-binding protein [Paenibacillus tyrfis]|uniref:extracellular solute-binding protein n=1 Tax=Paenibacillus tyrfis TaxID=1501230 RepID=UPI00209EC3DC|nr:extracellular solute-binding protein [Paenibacillus tyrfis]MCP1306131.1 extracellular solute-binding protein [Paenibacillus tyrfis]